MRNYSRLPSGRLVEWPFCRGMAKRPDAQTSETGQNERQDTFRNALSRIERCHRDKPKRQVWVDEVKGRC